MDLQNPNEADLVALVQQAYSSIEEVCSQLDDEDWSRPTDLPGWDVKDNLAHLASYEAIIAGRARAPEDIDISHATWADDDVAKVNEREIQWRRSRSGREVLEEFREVTAIRSKELDAMDDAAWEKQMMSPFGPMPARDFLQLRLLDLAYHEQDIRRATGRPGHLDGAVARFCFERIASRSMPRVVAKAAQAPDGSVVAFDVGAPGRAFGIRTEGGRGALVDATADAAARISCDLEAFLCLAGGRRTAQWAESEGRLRIEGDRALADRVLTAMVVTP